MRTRELIYGCDGPCAECGAPAEVECEGALLCPVHLGHECSLCHGEVLVDGSCDCRCEDCGGKVPASRLTPVCDECLRLDDRITYQDANGWWVEVPR